jgi:hypothetical protein
MQNQKPLVPLFWPIACGLGPPSAEGVLEETADSEGKMDQQVLANAHMNILGQRRCSKSVVPRENQCLPCQQQQNGVHYMTGWGNLASTLSSERGVEQDMALRSLFFNRDIDGFPHYELDGDENI